jgi:hypothetical protein
MARWKLRVLNRKDSDFPDAVDKSINVVLTPDLGYIYGVLYVRVGGRVHYYSLTHGILIMNLPIQRAIKCGPNVTIQIIQIAC